MARQTRSERRARREAQAASAAAAGAGAAAPPRTVSTTPDGAGELVRRRVATPGPHHERPRRFRFVRESAGELRKVEWPNQNQVIQGTAVVLIACIIVGVFLYASDLVFKRLVENVFLGQ